ncbi:spore germination protein [Bacillus sp. CHD6a]|uniref:spore germination protein n=1 Tax=Bacillus sp. CHD6a TaxID=1643452 RepID=UPI0006CD1A1C|nr:spore germination protein [Bacillus sp. CHD6a]KPB05318.1 spore gernimation protein GerA [Bacillus sp. CHD6a]
MSGNFDEDVGYLKERMAIDKSFDLIFLDLHYAGRKIGMFLVDGFGKDEIMLFLMKFLSDLLPEDLDEKPLDKLLKTYIPYVEIGKTDDLETVVDQVLAGPTVIIVEGLEEAIIIDSRTYPVRGPEEPDMERVVRGSRDGFVETMIFNCALIRRRIRDSSLRMEYLQVGRRSKTDISICYMDELADPDLVEKIKDSLKNIDTDGLPMAEKTLEEFVGGRHWNPYPTVRYTERPDTAAAHLYEGHVLVIVDGSPSVIITPATFWHHLQHAEEYRNKPVVGAYLRLVRFLAVWASIFILPLWYLLATNTQLLPDQLSYIGPTETGEVPLIAQILIIEIGMDMLRMAAIHTPTSLGTALGLVAAILIGDVAVKVGLFVPEIILYLAIAAIGTFSTPSYELSLANRLFRIVLLLLTYLFGVIGFMIGLVILIVFLMMMNSYNVPYLWPFIPFNYRGFRDVIIRSPIPLKNRRPTILHSEDPDR